MKLEREITNTEHLYVSKLNYDIYGDKQFRIGTSNYNEDSVSLYELIILFNDLKDFFEKCDIRYSRKDVQTYIEKRRAETFVSRYNIPIEALNCGK